MTTKNLLLAGALYASLALPVFATTYSGNGNTGFGGPVGNGSLIVTNDGSNITFNFTPSGSIGGNDLVIYIDSISGGYSSTAGFNDANDGGRKAVSGYTATDNGGGSGQSVLTFASGFNADYAIDIGSSYASLFGLANGGNNSLNYITGASQTGSPYSLTIPLIDLGLSTASGQTIGIFGTLVSESGYRSTEAIAGNDTSSGQGWIPFTQTSFGTYTVTAVPEPSTFALCGISSLAMLRLLRRR
jgi:hypothetical protein